MICNADSLVTVINFGCLNNNVWRKQRQDDRNSKILRENNPCYTKTVRNQTEFVTFFHNNNAFTFLYSSLDDKY